MKTRIAVLVIVLLLVACGMGSRDVFIMPPSLVGATFCVHNKPFTVMRSGLSPLDSFAVDRHEAEHRRQMGRNCEVVQALYAHDPHAALQMESLAYCVTLHSYPVADQNRIREKIEAGLVRFFRLSLPPEEVIAAYRFCEVA